MENVRFSLNVFYLLLVQNTYLSSLNLLFLASLVIKNEAIHFCTCISDGVNGLYLRQGCIEKSTVLGQGIVIETRVAIRTLILGMDEFEL